MKSLQKLREIAEAIDRSNTHVERQKRLDAFALTFSVAQVLAMIHAIESAEKILKIVTIHRLACEPSAGVICEVEAAKAWLALVGSDGE